MNIKQAILFILFWIFFLVNGYSQITIGSGHAPKPGALLDLKENNNAENNSTKGLRLPQVKLTSLKPATPAALASSIGSTGNWALADHIGLLVYNTNVNTCTAADRILQGLYVWDGSEWHLINKNPDVKVFTDPRDGETYTYRQFGDAGIWMTQHMRAITYSDGTPIAVYEGNTMINPPAKGMYAYVKASVISWDVKPSSWRKEFGVFYNYPAATRNYDGYGTTDQSQLNTTGIPGANEVENDTSLPTDYRGYHIVQGICPNGWHVPSDREWNELEKEIYQHADQYSSYTPAEVSAWNAAIPWNPDWEIHISVENRPSTSPTQAHGAAMESTCLIGGVSGGKSKPAELGGFEIPLLGHIYNKMASAYGTSGLVASSSVVNHQVVRTRMIESASPTVHRGMINKANLIPVRCKKNDLNM